MNVAVFGLGKLGAPMVGVFASSGHYVIGYDLSTQFVRAVASGVPPVNETGLKELFEQNKVRITATSDPAEAVRQADFIFVVVPTPSIPDGSFDSSYAEAAFRQIGKALVPIDDPRDFKVVVLVSTVMPGDMDSKIVPAIVASTSAVLGKDFGVAYNPEFIALGQVVHDMLHPDIVLIGASDASVGVALECFYKTVHDSTGATPYVALTNFVNAELAKLSVNCFCTTKISYANMLGDICEGIPGADAITVCGIIGHDQRIGNKYLKPATKFGGPCFPRDNRAMQEVARRIDVKAPINIATDAINKSRAPKLAVKVLASNPKTVAVLGMTYKPHTHVTEESVGTELVDTLGYMAPLVKVKTYDPSQGGSMAETVEGADVVVICTPWPEFKGLKTTAKVIDLWGILR